MLQRSAEKRLFKLVRRTAILLSAGLLYAAAVTRLGYGIPCPFRVLTGYMCPGCGVSRMCLCLMRGNIVGAFEANGAILLLLPAGAAFALYRAVVYVKQGRTPLPHGANYVIAVMAGALVCFGIVRNIV